MLEKSNKLRVRHRFPSLWVVFLIFLMFLYPSCTTNVPSLKNIPVVVGETPAHDANALVGVWRVKDFRVTSKGVISGCFELELDHSINCPLCKDILFVQVWSYYIWPQYGDMMSKPAGEFMPVFASQSTDTSVAFDLQGTFEVPPIEIDVDEGMPLNHLQVTLVWYRVNTVRENGVSYFAAKVGKPGDLPEQSRRGNTIVDQNPVSLNGTLDTNVRGGLEYPQWLMKNISLPTDTPATHLSPLEPPTPTFLSPPVGHN